MATGQDPSYSGSGKIYIKQQPANTTLGANTIITEEVTDIGGLQSQFGLGAFNGQILPGLISFTFAPNGSTISKCTIQVLDNAGNALVQTDGKTPTVWDLRCPGQRQRHGFEPDALDRPLRGDGDAAEYVCTNRVPRHVHPDERQRPNPS
jgi:hypothetical protein